jgi:hypothetical protein
VSDLPARLLTRGDLVRVPVGGEVTVTWVTHNPGSTQFGWVAGDLTSGSECVDPEHPVDLIRTAAEGLK